MNDAERDDDDGNVDDVDYHPHGRRGGGHGLDDDEGNVDDVDLHLHVRRGGGHGLDQPRPGRRDGHQCSCCSPGEEHGHNRVLNYCWT